MKAEREIEEDSDLWLMDAPEVHPATGTSQLANSERRGLNARS
jgi:hypothetical protein